MTKHRTGKLKVLSVILLTDCLYLRSMSHRITQLPFMYLKQRFNIDLKLPGWEEFIAQSNHLQSKDIEVQKTESISLAVAHTENIATM